MVNIQKPNKIATKVIDQTDIPANDEVLTFESASNQWKSKAGGSGSDPLTTKGDLFGFDTDAARIPIGTNAQVLTADSAEALGLKWAASAAGEANTSSNSGSGEGLALAKVSVDLPFKSLKATAPVTISSDSDSITYAVASSGTGNVVRVTSATLVTPALGVPASGTLTNMTGLPEAGLLDNAVTLAKMAGGTDGNLITYDTSGDPAFVATGSSTEVLTSNGAGTAPTFQAAGGGSGLTFAKIVKPDDETVNNSTTLQNDDDIVFTPTINKTYVALFIPIINSDATADWKYVWTVPTGATATALGTGQIWMRSTTLASFTTDITSSQAVSTSGSDQIGGFYFKFVMSSTAGNIQLQWAQFAAIVTDTKLLKGSILLVWEEN